MNILLRRTKCMQVAGASEIYDVLPWNDVIMRPFVPILNAVTPAEEDDGNTYPDVIGFFGF